MSFSDFLKKIFGEEKTEEPEISSEKIAFNELSSWIAKQEEDFKDKEQNLLVFIKNGILENIKDIQEKLLALENFDFQKRKDKERIEAIVKENWKNYIYYVKKFIQGFQELQENELEKLLAKANLTFIEFDRKSRVTYEKATFLIGKEMANVRNRIIAFSGYFKEVFNQNKALIDKSQTFLGIKLKLSQLDKLEENIKKINEKIKNLGNKIIGCEEKNKKTLEEVVKLRDNESYTANLKKKDRLEFEKQQIEREIYELKGLVDFRALGNIFHSNKRKVEILRGYKENFQESFQRDNGLGLLSLLVESKLNTEIVSKKIKQINDKQEEIDKISDTISEDSTSSLLAEIERVNLEIKNFEHEKEQELKLLERLKTRRQGFIHSIKEELAGLNVLVED